MSRLTDQQIYELGELALRDPVIQRATRALHASSPCNERPVTELDRLMDGALDRAAAQLGIRRLTREQNESIGDEIVSAIVLGRAESCMRQEERGGRR